MAMMGRSSDLPLVGFAHPAGAPPISVRHWIGHPEGPATAEPHVHDFLVLLYVARGPWFHRADGRDWQLAEGDAFVLAPGVAVAPAAHAPGGEAWAVFFPADAVDPAAAAPLVSWRGHPLLAPFVGDRRGGVQRLPVPAEDRAAWLGHLAALRDELARRRDGHPEAARAHLTLLLVRLGRLQVDAPAELSADPVLAAVLDLIEARFADPISLRDIASAVGLSPGHLTTVVGRGTGRTVQQWITERRMREARRLLVDTGLTVAEIAPRVGYRDPGYFVRRFRTAHGVTPAAWRRGS